MSLHFIPLLSMAMALAFAGLALGTQPAPTPNRKLRNPCIEPGLSPSDPPRAEEIGPSVPSVRASERAAVVEGSAKEGGGGDRVVRVQVVLLGKRHRSIDKSVAGGGLILGGLATTFLVAVFCYIRATGRENTEIAV